MLGTAGVGSHYYHKFFFAWIFGRLSILYPGDAGVSSAIEVAFGSRAKKLASFFLIGAVLFGPVAVMLTAAHYIAPENKPLEDIIEYSFLIVGAFLLMQRIGFIGRLALVLSSLAAAMLFIGSTVTLSAHSLPPVAIEPFSPGNFGYALLLLFWTIVGWEVVGNYSGDVHNPRKTIIRAVAFSALIIAIVSLSVAAAIQAIGTDDASQPVSVTAVVASFCEGQAGVIMAFLTASLCMTTYLLFVGGVARLMNALALTGSLPGIISFRTRTGAPAGAILILTVFHICLLMIVNWGWLDVEKLVALADGFFIGDALIGILAGVKLLDGTIIKGAALILAVVFLGILLFASPFVLGTMSILTIILLQRRLPYARNSV
jgi:APA family basic amino acid/polyamine antiporter